jgi:hypothetical protein
MSRTRASAKKAGSSFERLIADSLAWNLHDDRIDRRVKTGAADKGDIANLRTRDGQRLVVECKNTVRVDLGHWVREAATEAENDSALAGIVVHKRMGKGDPLEQYVTMTLRDLLLIGWGVTREKHHATETDIVEAAGL